MKYTLDGGKTFVLSGTQLKMSLSRHDSLDQYRILAEFCHNDAVNVSLAVQAAYAQGRRDTQDELRKTLGIKWTS